MTTTHFIYAERAALLAYLETLVDDRGQFSVAPDPNGVDEERTGWVVTGARPSVNDEKETEVA